MRLALVVLSGCNWAFGISEVHGDGASPTGDAAVDRWQSVAIGPVHACAIDTGGALYCWGSSSHAQTASLQASTQPTRVGSDHWTQVVAGRAHTCARRSDGAAFCWGENSAGQVDGTPSAGDAVSPRRVALPVGIGAVDEVAAGAGASCARAGDRIACWGDTGITLGTTSAPTEIIGHPWSHVAVGFDHACAIDDQQQAYCWGNNDHGQATGTGSPRLATPARVDVIGAVAIAAGTDATCAITAPGNVACWGTSAVTGFASGPPKRVMDGDGFTSIVVGNLTACAIAGGRASCWGAVAHGGLGDAAWSEVIAANGIAMTTSADAVAIAVGANDEESACALAGNSLACWGDNRGGQLGFPATLHPVPVTVAAPSGGWKAIAIGSRHSCAFAQDGAPSCWGADDAGQSSGTPGPDRPTPVAAPMPAVEELVAGTDFTCAREGTHLACWGTNAHGEVRAVDPSAHRSDATVDQSTHLAQTAGPAACDFGVPSLECWGLINGTATFGPKPVTQDASEPLKSSYLFGFGQSSSCALTGDHRVCWGYDFHGEFGNSFMNVPTGAIIAPTTITDSISWRDVALVAQHACGVDSSGFARCWGTNYAFESGQALGETVIAPQLVADAGHAPLMGCTRIAAGPAFACAACNGQVMCWGSNLEGQLGRDSEVRLDYLAVAVSGLAGAEQLRAGDEHACALAGGALACWGLSVRGQLGDGSHGSATPVAIP